MQKFARQWRMLRCCVIEIWEKPQYHFAGIPRPSRRNNENMWNCYRTVHSCYLVCVLHSYLGHLCSMYFQIELYTDNSLSTINITRDYNITWLVDYIIMSSLVAYPTGYALLNFSGCNFTWPALISICFTSAVILKYVCWIFHIILTNINDIFKKVSVDYCRYYR